MNSRLFFFALPVGLLGAALIAPGLAAQSRGGMRGPAGGGHMRGEGRSGERDGAARPFRRGFYANYGYFLPPYLYPEDDYFDYNEPEPLAPAPATFPVQLISGTAAQPSAAPPAPVMPLLLEVRDGQWVRIPTGSQMSLPSSSTSAPGGAQSPTPRAAITEPAEVLPPSPALPPAVIVFRDGRTEEVGKYMIQGTTLYTSADYWSTGTWTRKIPLSDLDIPASLKLNKEHGTKFNLPSSPNEVVIRF